MSPTVFKIKNYRFFFFSREEERMHIHIVSPDGEAKFWLEPIISLANYSGFKTKQLKELQSIIEENTDEISKKWHKHFGL
jgi:Domain of unknown function (DUF4160)